ncbi:hypothetical protein HBB16_09675 [Pseudonocardia sp. MCCB 268]|nr:hypothetical protein [Pseudonocardia cytotoxica]
MACKRGTRPRPSTPRWLQHQDAVARERADVDDDRAEREGPRRRRACSLPPVASSGSLGEYDSEGAIDGEPTAESAATVQVRGRRYQQGERRLAAAFPSNSRAPSRSSTPMKR